MTRCPYIYCEALINSEQSVCGECGCTVRPVFKPATINLHRGQGRIIDMHQIVAKDNNSIDAQLNSMQANLIDLAILQSVPDKMKAICNNGDLRKIKNAFPDKFIISQFVDPRYILAKGKLKEYLTNGTRIIKLLPCLGYYPDEKKLDRFWRKMEENKQVAMVHSGFISARHKNEEKKNRTYLSSKYCNPIFFDTVCRKFPDLQIILCHAGGSMWYEEACAMINQHENVWCDISGFGNIALTRILTRNISVEWSKVMWGNDSLPVFYTTNLNLLNKTLQKTEKEYLRENLLYGNARTFLTKNSLYAFP
jgi:predicted TIM-barrel fold metal-dependent hydrolase